MMLLLKFGLCYSMLLVAGVRMVVLPDEIDHTPAEIDHTPVEIDHSPVEIDHMPVEIAHAPQIVMPPHIAAAGKIHFEDCGSEFKIARLTVSGCQRTPCPMPWNQHVTIEATFDNGQIVRLQRGDRLKHTVYWMLKELEDIPAQIGWPDNDDATVRNANKLQASLFVDPSIASGETSGSLYWKSTTNQQVTALCFRLPVVIKKMEMTPMA